MRQRRWRQPVDQEQSDQAFAQTMRNAESATFEECTALNAKLPLFLASKVRPDDVLRPGDSFWIAASSTFSGAFEEMCRELKLRVRKADTVDFYEWVRDPFFRTAHLPQESYRLPGAHEKAAPSGTALAHNHWASHLSEPLAEMPKVHPDDTDDPLEPRFGSGSNVMFIPTTGGRFLEGGNVFITGERRCVMGHDELRHGIDRSETPLAGLSSEQVDRIAGRYNAVSREQAVSLWRARREAKREVKALLGAEALVVIPQYLFHIDLQMGYLGNEQFLIHSFAATLEFLRDREQPLRKELGDKAYEAVLQSKPAARRARVGESASSRRPAVGSSRRAYRQSSAARSAVDRLMPRDDGDTPTGLYSQFANGVAFEGGFR